LLGNVTTQAKAWTLNIVLPEAGYAVRVGDLVLRGYVGKQYLATLFDTGWPILLFVGRFGCDH
jgi:hypothetical protein